jgi:DNA polymerase III subunit delta
MPPVKIGHPPATLLAKLKARPELPLVLLLGTDSYLRDMCRRKLIETYVDENARDWAVTRVSAEEIEWPEIFQLAQTMPMLSPRQVVLVSEIEALERLGEDEAKKLTDSLSSYLANPAPFTVLVLMAAKLDSRRRLLKALNENPRALIVSLEADEKGAATLALQMATDLGAHLDAKAASALADALNGEPARMHIEIEKLATYAAGRRITTQDVQALVVSARKDEVWKFAELLATRQRTAALDLLDCLLREGQAAPLIIGGLVWMYRNLIEASEISPSANQWDAARALSLKPERAQTVLRQARRIPRADLLRGLVALAEADSETKSNVPDERALMDFLVARLTATSSAPGAGRE